MRAYLELIKIDLKLAMRLRAVIFFNYLFPLIFFFTFAALFRASSSRDSITQVMTMSVALGVLGNGLFGAGMRAIQEREMNILRRYKVTPITARPLLVASMVTGWIIFIPYIVVLLTLAHYRYNMPWPARMGELLVFISLGLVAFRSIGLVIASVANNMQEGTILIQLLYFPMLFLSGATIPLNVFPASLATISKFIPATYLVTGVTNIMRLNQRLTDNLPAIGALLITAVVGSIVGIKLFRWEKEEKIPGTAKLWVAAVLLPFLIMGVWQWVHKESPTKPAKGAALETKTGSARQI